MKRRATQIFVVALVLIPFLSTTIASAYTTDIFATAGPSGATGAASAGSQGATYQDASGAAVYSIPLPTAPNRGGMVPQLEISYSSSNPIRGGLAMGWSLPIPFIELDTTNGRLEQASYRSSVGGRLVRSNDPIEAGWEAFRGQEDASYTRYERRIDVFTQASLEWRARTLDGRVLYFGQTDESKDTPHNRSQQATEGRWFLTKVVDRFGNEIVYTYAKVEAKAPEGVDIIPVDISLEQIEYGANAIAGLPHHSRLRFAYAPLDLCSPSNVPVGAQFDFRTGFPLYKGARRLTEVILEVVGANGAFGERRRLSLSYDQDELGCPGGAAHAPLRILTAVQERAISPNGAVTTMPPVTFTYNRKERLFDLEETIQDDILPYGVSPNKNGFGRDITNAMLLDLNRDARVDKIDLTDLLENGALSDTKYCTASWSLNEGALFGAPSSVGVEVQDRSAAVLPSLPWEGPDRNPSKEYCSLTHQQSSVQNADVFDPTNEELCDPGPGAPYRPGSKAHQMYRWIDIDEDGLPDLVTAVESNRLSYRPELDPRVGPTLACTPEACNGDWLWGFGCDYEQYQNPVCASTEDAERFRKFEAPCHNLLYRVYRNQGNGSFAPAVAWDAPIPLEQDETPAPILPQSDQLERAIRSLLIDLDGDGRSDGVKYHQISSNTPEEQELRITRGRHQTGGFYPESLPWRLPTIWGMGESEETYLAGHPLINKSFHLEDEENPICPPHPLESEDDCRYEVIGQVAYPVASLEDINADGLLDYVDSRGKALRVFYNTGVGFETYDLFPVESRGTPLSDDPTLRFLSQRETIYPATGFPPGSRQSIRMVDFDSDGLQDIVVQPPRGSGFNVRAQLYLNRQDRFVYAGESDLLREVEDAISQKTKIGTNTVGSRPWNTLGDFFDLNGDGLPEAIQDKGNFTTALSDSDSQPMRLLQSIQDGRGLTITYYYQTLSGVGVPHPLTVVSSVYVHPGPDADGVVPPPSVTGYEYLSPVYNQDLTQEWGFRGFETVITYLPSGARSITERSFAQSYAGLVTEERIEDYTFEDGTPHSDSVTRYTYTRDEIAGYAPPAQGGTGGGPNAPPPGTLGNPDPIEQDIVTFHTRTKEVYTCGAEQGYNECLASGVLRAETYNWVPLPANTPAIYTQESLWVGEQFSPHPGMQVQGSLTRLLHTESTYRTMPANEAKYVYDETNTQRLIGYVVFFTDASDRVVTYTSRRVNDTGIVAVTSEFYDMSTGNKIGESSPNHYGTGIKKSFSYDSKKVFIEYTQNELGHEVYTRFDPATGALLEQRGPNQKQPAGQPLVKEGFVQLIDGLGRVLSRSVAFDDPVLGYRMIETNRTSYVDSPRVKITSELRIYPDQDQWIRTESELDGLQREIIARSYEGATVKTVSKNYFDVAGNLVRASIPKPDALDLSTVDWSFGYDALGRLTKEAQPARAGCTTDLNAFTYCGQAWFYDGLTTTRIDVAGTLGGAISETTTTNDIFSQLIQVDETTNAGLATTTYRYDGNNNVTEITNADGVVTSMHHDELGRRVSIKRGGETWEYGYDPNGNLISFTVPYPSGALKEDYTTTIAYDDLNRETSRLVGRRDLSDDELALFGDGAVYRVYDLGVNGLGRLSEVTQFFGPNDPNITSYEYEARGLVSRESRGFSILEGQFQDNRTTSRFYTAHGKPWTIRTADGATEAQSTTFQHVFDGRGLPYATYWVGQPNWMQQVQRTNAGMVYQRSFSVSGQLISQTNWTLDSLGRPSSISVNTTLPGQTTATPRAAEQFVFDGVGNVSTLYSLLSPTSAASSWDVWNFGYDRQHQLTSAKGPLGYQASFEFSPGGRITRANVSADPAAARVYNRDVTYFYGDTMGGGAPDAPVALKMTGTNNDWMTISYDDAGNAIARNIEKESYRQRYDGTDQQRLVINQDGAQELSFYDASNVRTIVAELDANGGAAQVRWSFGDAEIWYDGDGQVVREFATTSIDGIAARVNNHTRRETLTHDPRGHLLGTISEDGEVLAAFTYGPFGELLRQEGSEQSNYPKRFNGKERSQISGLSYYGYRYYDEYSLSWTQADPLYLFLPERKADNPRLASLYAFTGNNPVRFFDPDGRQPKGDRRHQPIVIPQSLMNVWKKACGEGAEALACFNYLKDKYTEIKQKEALLDLAIRELGEDAKALDKKADALNKRYHAMRDVYLEESSKALEQKRYMGQRGRTAFKKSEILKRRWRQTKDEAITLEAMQFILIKSRENKDWDPDVDGFTNPDAQASTDFINERGLYFSHPSKLRRWGDPVTAGVERLNDEWSQQTGAFGATRTLPFDY